MVQAGDSQRMSLFSKDHELMESTSWFRLRYLSYLLHHIVKDQVADKVVCSLN